MVIQLKLPIRSVEDIDNRYEQHPYYRAIQDAVTKYERELPSIRVSAGEFFYIALQVLDNLKENQADYAIHNLWQDIQNGYNRYCNSATAEDTCLAADIVCAIVYATLVISDVDYYRNNIARIVYNQISIRHFPAGLHDLEFIFGIMEKHTNALNSWLSRYMESEDFESDAIRRLIDTEKDVVSTTTQVSMEQERIHILIRIYGDLKSNCKLYKGKAQWFYIYKLMEERGWYLEKQFSQFIRDLDSAGVPDDERIETSVLSTKHKTSLRSNTRYPDWLMRTRGGRTDIITAGKGIAKIAEPYIKDITK